MKKNAETPEPIMAVCVVCGEEAEIHYSLSLEKDKEGVWHSNPVCQKHRQALIEQAMEEKLFIPFFPIQVSEREAKKRNERALLHRPFLEKFGRAREQKAEPKPIKKAEAKPKLKVAKS